MSILLSELAAPLTRILNESDARGKIASKNKQMQHKAQLHRAKYNNTQIKHRKYLSNTIRTKHK